MNLIEYTRMYEVEDHHWWYVGLHNLILETVQRESLRLGRPLRIFDAGCGTGRLCQLMSMKGHTVEGCDMSEEALRLCQHRGVDNVFQADLNTIDLEPETFDVITSIDVLYHAGIADDVEVMRHFRRALKPGGLLILNLVAHEFLRSTHDIAVHTRERYTTKTLSLRLLKAGFNVESAGYRVSLLFPLILVYRLIARFLHPQKSASNSINSDIHMPNKIINSLLLNLIRLENSALDHFFMPFGSSVFAVARICHKE